MKFRTILVAVLCVSSTGIWSTAKAADNNRTMRGWFVDESCTRERVAAGRIEPSNPECAKQCVKDGSKLMFLSETDKALFEVKNPAAQVKNIGWYVELAGSTDDKKVLTVNTLKRLSEVNASCKRPPLKDKK